MAEIKSTLELVLARADKLCEKAATPEDNTLYHEGMRCGASFMNETSVDISQEITSKSPAEQTKFIQGLLQTFMRNLNLPREENSPWETAITGLTLAAQSLQQTSSASQIISHLNEVKSVLGRYLDHRQQLKSQLEENFAMQTNQLEQNLATQTGMRMKIQPDQHPKFIEEWQKVTAQMNEQYNNALDQYKDAITQLFSSTD